MLPWWSRLVLTLWLYRSTPASLSATASSSESSPRQAQIFSGSSCLISRTAAVTSASSSPRVSSSPASALSAKASQRFRAGAIASSGTGDLRFMGCCQHDGLDVDVLLREQAQALGCQLALERGCPAEHRDFCELLD